MPPPEPPPIKQRHSSLEHHRSLEREQPIPQPLDKKGERERNGTRNFENVARKMSHELLSRSSALNDRYFETDKSRSKSLDDLLAGGGAGDAADPQLTPSEHDEQDPLPELGLSESRLNDRYHSAERLAPLVPREQTPRYQKSQYAGRRTAGSHSRYMERSDYATRSSAMSDTSEAPSLASHVRRVRVPSQASDVDQFLDELFSPVLDGSLDELSDARSLSASIRGEREHFAEAPIAIDADLDVLGSARNMCCSIKGGGGGRDGSDGSDKDSNEKANNGTTATLDREVEDINNPMEVSLDEYITGELIIWNVFFCVFFVFSVDFSWIPIFADLFQPIFVNDSLKRLTEKSELADAIKGGGTTHQPNTSNGLVASPLMAGATTQESFSPVLNVPAGADPMHYQQHMQRAFLQSAMVQNLQIQQQLLAQNQALKTLLNQQETATSPTQSPSSLSNSSKSPRKSSFKGRVTSPLFVDSERNRKASSDSNSSHVPPPPPPPMPPPMEYHDPSGTRPFLDPYGRAKTVRIGKWRWPPPQDGSQPEIDENFMHFKMRQNQRKNTPQSQDSSPNGTAAPIEWDEFEVESILVKASNGGPVPMQHQQRKYSQNENSPRESMATAAATAAAQATKLSRRSFEIGADRPTPGSVGKLKLSSEMRQRLEQVTAGHSVRSSTSTTSGNDLRAPNKLEDARRMMLQQQLSGHFLAGADKLDGNELPSVRSQVQRMEKRPANVPPAPPSFPAPPPPIRPPTTAAPVPIMPQSQELPAFFQRQERDTFGIHQTQQHHQQQQQHQQQWNDSEDAYDSWSRAETGATYKKDMKNDRERSRSRSRSRDRENFSEAVWDRNEVEGPPSAGSERIKEREKRDRIYEMKQVERERESQKVYQPSAGKAHIAMYEREREKEKPVKKTSVPQVHERATFKTHMTQRMDRERKTSASTMATQNTDKLDDTDFDYPVSAIPAPVPVPPSLKSPAAACLTYNRVPWRLRVRKEVFHPNESIGSPAALDLLFAQVSSDVLGITPCLRITAQEKRNALNLLGGHGVALDNVKSQNVRAIVKRHLVDMARGWPLYFARLFVVSASPQFPEITILAVSHSGVYLARRETENVSVVLSVPFSDLHGAATLPRPAALQLNLMNGNRIVLHAPRASAIQTMIQTFSQEFKQVGCNFSHFILSSIAAAFPFAARDDTVACVRLSEKRYDSLARTRRWRPAQFDQNKILLSRTKKNVSISRYLERTACKLKANQHPQPLTVGRRRRRHGLKRFEYVIRPPSDNES